MGDETSRRDSCVFLDTESFPRTSSQGPPFPTVKEVLQITWNFSIPCQASLLPNDTAPSRRIWGAPGSRRDHDDRSKGS